MLPVTVARSFSDGVAIRYVGLLPVLRITSCFMPCGGPMGRMKHDVIFRRVRQVALPGWTSGQLQCLVEFVRMRHREESLLSTIALLLIYVCTCTCTAHTLSFVSPFVSSFIWSIITRSHPEVAGDMSRVTLNFDQKFLFCISSQGQDLYSQQK